MRKIKILGAGISGLTAAINLVRAGYDVEVFEKNKDCGMRYHGDYQGLENWTQEIDILEELKEMGIKKNFDCKPFIEMVLCDCNLKKYKVKSSRPNYYLVRRGPEKMGRTLDQSIKKQAIKEGVGIKFNKIVNEEEVDIVGTGSHGGDALGQGITFNTDAPDTAITILDNDIAPGGYAYLFVVNNRGSIVTWYFRNFHESHDLLEKTIKKFDKVINLNRTNVKRFGGAVNFFLRRKYTNGDQLLVGERAGLQDFFASFGMRYAIASGYLAAKSIVESKSYNTMIDEKFKDLLNSSIVNRFLWERMSNRRFAILLNKLKIMEDTNKFLREMSKMTFLKRIILPVAKYSMKGKHRYDCECVWCRSTKQELD